MKSEYFWCFPQDHERSEPINSFAWGADNVASVRFNPVRIYPSADTRANGHADVL